MEHAAENLIKVGKTASLLMFPLKKRIHKHLADQCPYCWTPILLFFPAFHGADILSLIADNPLPRMLNTQHD